MTAGASAVLLYGSLARGTQSPNSDIDLVAVFDDLDYSARWSRKVELTRLARQAAGRPVEVRVTDWPEWTHRSERLRTSFERGVAGDAVVLCESPNGSVNWEKEIGMPTSDAGDAALSLDHASDALRRIETALEPAPAERRALAHGDADDYLSSVAVRLRAVCAESQTALETALKALVHLYGAEPPGRVHHLDELLAKLRGHRVQQAARELMVGLDLAEVTLWRQRGTYPGDFPGVALPALTVHAHRLAAAAGSVACLAADHLEDVNPASGRAVAGTRRLTAAIEHALDRWDLTRTTPTAQMGIPEPPQADQPTGR